jgi:magnesium transporter
MKNESDFVLVDPSEIFDENFTIINDLLENDEYDRAIAIMQNLHYADLADFLDNIKYSYFVKIISLLQEHLNPQILVSLNVNRKGPVIEILGVAKSAELINKLDIEDVVEILEEIDADIKELILEKLHRRQQIIEASNYPENTVGRIVERNFVYLFENWTVKQSLDFLKSKQISDDFHAAIVVDSKFKPIGTISLSVLLQNQNNDNIKKLVAPVFKSAYSSTDLSEIIYIFKQYALTIVPVVNTVGKLVGTVSIKNMLYIIEEQTEKDIMSITGIQTQDTFHNFFYTVRNRISWLFGNLITACITAMVINQFSDTISRIIALAAIMPIVVSIGGNAGIQVMTVTVRAIANKDIHNSNLLKVILKEIVVSAFNGVMLASVGSFILLLMLSDIKLSLVFALAVTINFIMAGFFGCVIPIALDHLDIDVATGAGVFLAIVTDALGSLSFLTLAYIFLI